MFASHLLINSNIVVHYMTMRYHLLWLVHIIYLQHMLCVNTFVFYMKYVRFKMVLSNLF